MNREPTAQSRAKRLAPRTWRGPADSLPCLREDFANQPFAPLPERLCVLRIESVAAHSFVKHAQFRIIRDDVTHVAVLAIPPSNFFGGRNDSCPNGGRGSLGNC